MRCVLQVNRQSGEGGLFLLKSFLLARLAATWCRPWYREFIGELELLSASEHKVCGTILARQIGVDRLLDSLSGNDPLVK